MNKKTIFSIFAVTVYAVSLSIPAFALSRYDEHFETEEYPYFYTPSSAEISHDGHGNFMVSGGNAISSAYGFTTVISPGQTAESSYPASPSSWQGTIGPIVSTPLADVLQIGGKIGTLRFLGKTVSVYEGTSNSSMAKGAGHFTGTSVWNGNCCFAGHNRGTNAWFYHVKDLKEGDLIEYSTVLGSRKYRVIRSRIISVNDFSPLEGTLQNQLTMITCVANEPGIRLCVQAVEI